MLWITQTKFFVSFGILLGVAFFAENLKILISSRAPLKLRYDVVDCELLSRSALGAFLEFFFQETLFS